MKQYHRYFLVFGLVLLTSIVLTCSKDSTDPQEPLPDLPPLSSFVMDFNSFPTSGGEGLAKSGSTLMQTKDNWGFAVVNVLVWNTVIFVNLAVPVAAFGAAVQNDPYKEEDGSWSWSYGFNAQNSPYTAKLNLSLHDNLAHWKMYIHSAGETEGFLWYHGEGDLGYSHGTWTVNKNPASPVPYIGIEWNKDPQTNTGNIRYTNIEENSPDKGSYIEYGDLLGSRYNGYYTVYTATNDNFTYIEWEKTTKEGRVSDLNHFQNEDWHCWDATLNDVECP